MKIILLSEVTCPLQRQINAAGQANVNIGLYVHLRIQHQTKILDCKKQCDFVMTAKTTEKLISCAIIRQLFCCAFGLYLMMRLKVIYLVLQTF